MKILVFGMLAEDVGSGELEIEVQSDTDSLKNHLLKQYPSLKDRQFMVAVNKLKVTDNMTLKPADEIALIPPFAGG